MKGSPVHIAWYVVMIIALALLAVLLFGYRRRRLALSQNAIEMSVHRGRGLLGGWAMGVATYTDTEIRWYRLSSFLPVPSDRFSRIDGQLQSQRAPRSDELMWIPPDSVIFEFRAGAQSDQLAVARSAATGLLSWWESAPPGLRTDQRDIC
ncbi:MAG: DUF2550 domain-containing protein [Antricoccus sp.]